MVTRDSSACMKAPRTHQLFNVSCHLGFLTLGSCTIRWEDPKKHPKTKHYVDRQTGYEVMAIFGHPRWRQPPSWIFEIRKLHHYIGRPRKPYPRTKYYVYGQRYASLSI